MPQGVLAQAGRKKFGHSHYRYGSGPHVRGEISVTAGSWEDNYKPA